MAAAVITAISVASYFKITDKNAPIDPNLPILTLANGSQVNLDGSSQKLQQQQGAFKVYQTENVLEYQHQPDAREQKLLYNTVTTPKDVLQQIVLPDGSKALVKEESSICYPLFETNMGGEVEVKGEVYFDVGSDRPRPFTVRTNGIALMGVDSRFNIKSFPTGDSVKAELLKGKMTLVVHQDTFHLKAGETALIRPGGPVKINTTNTANDQPIAQNETFISEDTEAYTIVEEVARWNKLKVVYLDKPTFRIISCFNTSHDLSYIQEKLERAGVFTKLEGKTLKVSTSKIKP